jgi:hypothetical protein
MAYTRLEYLLFALFVLNISAFAFAQAGSSGGSGPNGGNSVTGNFVSQLTTQFCSLINGVRAVIGVLALLMFLVGAILYAGGHFLPTAGQVKGSAQGWAMGMIIGSLIGVVLFILAPYIISFIVGFGNGQIAAPSC